MKRKLVRLLNRLFTKRYCYVLDPSEVRAVSVEAINNAVHDTGWPESLKLTI